MRQTASQNWRITALERRVEALERMLTAKTSEPREDDPATPTFDEATGDFAAPEGRP